MKSYVRLVLSAGLLFSSLQSQNAQTLLDGLQTGLDREIGLKVGIARLPINSGPELQSVGSQSTSKFVTVDGTRLHFVIRGSGPAVVLIHGNPGSSQDWTHLFAPLAAHHEVIAFDRPGHGRSQRPKQGDATVEVQARLLHSALKQLHVSFITQLPAVPVLGDAVNSVLTPLFGASVVRRKLKKAFSPDPVPTGYLRSVLSEWTSPKKVRAYSLDEVSLNDSLKKVSPRYSEIRVPVSILAGDSDLIVPEKDNAERLHQALPKSRLIVLPKTGHEIPFTRPQAVVNEIERVQRLSRVRT